MAIPIYQQIKNILHEDIDQGKYLPGDLLPSVNQLAKMFATSRNTAVKAITDLAQEGVIYCVQGRGSIVNDPRKVIQAGNKSAGRKEIVPDIGILLANFDKLDNPYFVRLLQGISDQAQKTSCNLKTFCINNYLINEFIRTESFDGLIIATKLPLSSVMLLKKHNIPFVLAGNDVYGENHLCVSTDNYDTTNRVIKYLHSLGHEKIAVLPGPASAYSTPGYYLAYKNTMKELGLEFKESFFRACEYGEEGGYETFKKMLRSKNIPTAIFAAEDNIAVGIIAAAEENFIKVPEELSIVGNGDRFPCSNVKIPLTTFSDCLIESGALCLELLLQKLNGQKIKNTKISLTPELIIRESCAKILPLTVNMRKESK
jgi:LacI family transcriptional regulator, galactose operon repressor